MRVGACVCGCGCVGVGGGGRNCMAAPGSVPETSPLYERSIPEDQSVLGGDAANGIVLGE